MFGFKIKFTLIISTCVQLKLKLLKYFSYSIVTHVYFIKCFTSVYLLETFVLTWFPIKHKKSRHLHMCVNLVQIW